MKHLKTLKEFIESINEERETYITEVADWDDPKKRAQDRNTISCDDDEAYELEVVVKAVKKEYPGIFKDSEIDAAIEHCCKKEGQSRQREDFYKCVYSTLFDML